MRGVAGEEGVGGDVGAGEEAGDVLRVKGSESGAA